MDSGRSQTIRPATGELKVAIVAGEPEFAQALTNRWQAERVVPLFTVLAAEIPENGAAAFDRGGEPVPVSLPECDLVVLGGVAEERLPQLQRALYRPPRPLVCVVETAGYRRLRDSWPHLLLLAREKCWEDNVVLLASECMRRLQAVLRAQRAEELLIAGQRHATLGKYVLEMRHNLNNALTSVLGNSELMLLNGEGLPAVNRDQLETIRNHALRLHEIMQRFWSLESEMRVIEDASLAKASGVIAPSGSPTEAVVASGGVKVSVSPADAAVVSVKVRGLG